MKVIERKLSNGNTVFIEVAPSSGLAFASQDGKVAKDTIIKKAADIVDEAFDKLVENEITEYCNILINTFKKISTTHNEHSPEKANAEFGFQCEGGGNVYLANIAAQASIKVSFEWDLSKFNSKESEESGE